MCHRHLYAILSNFSQCFNYLDLTKRVFEMPEFLSIVSEARERGFQEISEKEKKKGKGISGKLAVNKGYTTKFIEHWQLEWFLEHGWKRGKRKTSKDV
jgi:hypothetical protein